MLCLCTSSSSSVSCSFKPSLFLSGGASFTPSIRLLKPSNRRHSSLNKKKKIRYGICRAELSQDAPFAAAIGACILSSLVLPIPGRADEESDAVIDSTDTRFAVMGIISFIPYFNWLSWVFAWLDTGKRRYAVYALVYLAPYLRSNLSLSPEESWLPIASIIFCVIHIQLEASLRNGDIKGFQFLNEASKHLSASRRNRDNHFERHDESSEEGNRTSMDLPPGEEKSRNEIRNWGIPKRPSKDQEAVEEDWDEEERRKH